MRIFKIKQYSANPGLVHFKEDLDKYYCIGLGKEFLKLMVPGLDILNDNIKHWLDITINDYLSNISKSINKLPSKKDRSLSPVWVLRKVYTDPDTYLQECIKALKTDKSGGALKYINLPEVKNLGEKDIPDLTLGFKFICQALSDPSLNLPEIFEDPYTDFSKITSRKEPDFKKSISRDSYRVTIARSIGIYRKYIRGESEFPEKVLKEFNI